MVIDISRKLKVAKETTKEFINFRNKPLVKIIRDVSKKNSMSPERVGYYFKAYCKSGLVDHLWKTNKHTDFINKRKLINLSKKDSVLRGVKKYIERLKEEKAYYANGETSKLDKVTLCKYLLYKLVSTRSNKDIFENLNITYTMSKVLYKNFRENFRYNDCKPLDKIGFQPADLELSIKYYNYKNKKFSKRHMFRLNKDENFKRLIKYYGAEKLLLTYETIRRYCEFSILESQHEKYKKKLQEKKEVK